MNTKKTPYTLGLQYDAANFAVRWVALDGVVADARRQRADMIAGGLVWTAKALYQAGERLIVRPLVAAYLRGRLRRDLEALDDRVLADIGLTRDAIPQVVQAAYRPHAAPVAPAPHALATPFAMRSPAALGPVANDRTRHAA